VTVKTAEKSTFPQKRTRKEKRLRSVRREKNLSGRHAARRRRPHAGQRGLKKFRRTIDLEILLLSPVDLFLVLKINGRKQKALQQENDTNSEQAKGEQLFQHEQRRN
jgi:hypothetical protein